LADYVQKAVRLEERLALTPAELADALGISERTLRDMRPPLPRIRVGRRVLYPIRAVEHALEQRACQEAKNASDLERDLERELLGRFRK
jgi:hypothetical protein